MDCVFPVARHEEAILQSASARNAAALALSG